MKIAYNPMTAAALTVAPSNNDITFDLKGVAIYAKGVKFKGTDTTYSVFKKHTASGNTGGYNGLVPVPSYTTTAVRFLREDGSWVTPTNTTYSVVSSTANGLAPAIGTTCSTTIATQADEWVLTSTKGGTPTWRKLPANAFKNDNTNTTYTLSGGLSGNNYTVTLTPSSGNATTATIPVMTGATSSAAGKAGLVPAPGTANTGQFLKGDGTWATPSDTHWTTHLYIGAKDAANNAATTNGNTYIKVTDNSTIRNQYIIKGAGRATVASDASGNITITSPTVTWSEISGKPSSFAPSSHTHSQLQGWADTRSAANVPNDYNGIFRVQGIKTAGTTLGLTSTLAGTYATIIGWRGWSDSSGGYAWEIASTDKNRLYVRSGSTTSWNNSWTAIAYTSDLTWSNISGKPSTFAPSAHNHPTSQINALTGYSKAGSAANLTTTDTLNAALGKLEYKAHYAYDWVISVTSTDTDEYINKWGEIVGFLDSVKEGTDILDEFVTRKTALVITGQKNFNTNTGATPVIISRGGGPTEAVAIGINDSQAVFEYTNDEKANSYVFKMINTDTEASDGSGANTSLVTFAGSSAGSSVTATTFIGRLNNTLTFSAGAFATKTYNNSSAVTVNIPTHTSHLTNNSGFLTSRGYIGTTAVLASSATQNLTGIGSASFSGIVTINTSIQNHSSPTALCLVINSTKIPDGTTLSLKNSPGIGFHIANHSWGSLVFNGNFNFINNDATSFMPVKASKFVTNGGTSSLFVKGDGSLDSNTYLTSHLSLANYVTLNGAQTISGVKTFSTQQKFTVATGTSPFTVTSTTKVTNLNADMVDSYHISTAGTTKPWSTIVTIGSDGVSEMGRYIDFHYDNTTGSDYSTRLLCGGNHSNVVTLPSATGTLALTSLIPTVTNYYWANVKVSSTSSTTTTPTFATATVSGTTTTKNLVISGANQYRESGGIILSNSDIWGINAIYTLDLADAATEGYLFKRTNGNYDSLWCKDGVFYFSPNGNPTDGYSTNTNILKAIKSITRSGTTFTYTCLDGTTGTFTLLDNNTTYSAGTGLALSDKTFRTTVPRVAKSCNSIPGANTWVLEEYTSGTSYNLPSNAYYHIYTAEGSDTKYATQLALGMTTNAAYYRNYNNKTWSQWYSIINTNTTYSAGTGISLSGTTFSNAGVRSTTINGNYLRVNTNGTNADLTIPYATKAGDADTLDGYHRSNLFTSYVTWMDVSGLNKSITVGGNADTYYPVVISVSSSKLDSTRISVWKDLGSTTPSYSGNHSNGTSSLWLIYEGRNWMWDGNGGFIKTWYKYQGYATLVAHAELAGSGVGNLVLYLRGGGCLYNIACSNSFTATVYTASTNIGSSSYPVNVAPRTTIGNGGIILSKLGYGSVDSASTATLASTVTVNNSDSNSTYRMVWHSGNNLYSTAGIYCNPSTDYLYASSMNASDWFRSSGNTGWYNPTNNCHVYPNATTTYGGLMFRGEKGGYTGFVLGTSNSYMNLMDNGTDKGLYLESNGLWILYYNRSSKKVGILTSTITKTINLAGSTYISSTLDMGGAINTASTPGSWVSGMSGAAILYRGLAAIDASSFWRFFNMKSSGGHVVCYGGLGNDIGFYGYYSGRTANGTDWRFTVATASGNWTATASIYAAHFYENSDLQLKTNIQEILNSDKMPIIKEFDWKESNSHSYGLIAQELEEQGYSELVSTKDDGYKTVNYSAALSLIVGKLQVKIRELEKEIENLKNKN